MNPQTAIVLDPYRHVNWKTYAHYKAALHLHTRQSDGIHYLDEVVRKHHELGFRILSVTDHDWNRPDRPPEKYSPYPFEPRPHNYPANPTWPWSEYGTQSPYTWNMIGIQGNELTYRHHINSYFSDYGIWYEKTGQTAPFGGIVNEVGDEIWEDDQLYAIRDKGGLAILNHPGTPDETSWWVRQSLDWYVDRYRKHHAAYLIGLEVTNEAAQRKRYAEDLWDQLLARFMPHRPIWGFGTNDMHRMDSVKLTFSVFPLAERSEKAVRTAMETGQFYCTTSTENVSFLDQVQLDVFPVIEAIAVDEDEGTIRIQAANCDQIRWISAPESLEPIADHQTSDHPWPAGKTVHQGPELDYHKTPGLANYVRAELVTHDGDAVHRTLTNPWGLENLV